MTINELLAPHDEHVRALVPDARETVHAGWKNPSARLDRRRREVTRA